LHKGAVVDLPDAQAREFLRRGFVEHYQTKVIHAAPATPGNPLEAVGTVQQPSASPAAQASPQTTSSESESGKRKRGRPRKDQSS
jgi:hypothetical protein